VGDFASDNDILIKAIDRKDQITDEDCRLELATNAVSSQQMSTQRTDVILGI